MQVKTEGPATAKIMLVGEAPGSDEAYTGRNFVGHAGRILDALLKQTPIMREECLITNVCRDQPPNNNIKFFFEDSKCTRPKPLLLRYIDMLKDDIVKYRPNIVVGLGRTALFALTGQHSIGEFRGYIMESTLVPRQKCICTYHPIKVDNEWKLHFPAIMDLRKAFSNSSSPEMPLDKRSLNASPSKREFIEYLQWLYNDYTGNIALDVETKSPGSHVDILGIAHSPDHAMSLNLFSGKEARFHPQDEHEVWLWLAKVLSVRGCIQHNAIYDTNVLWYNNRILTKNLVADTLLAAHVAWPENPRSLGFLASICLNIPPWKHTQTTMPTLYNAGDAANTLGIWSSLKAEIERQGIWDTFNFEMRQVYPAAMLQLQGYPIDKEVQHKLLHNPELDDDNKKKGIYPRLEDLTLEIEKELGKKVNLGSPAQLKQVLYGDLGLPEQYKRRKSITEVRKVTTDAEALNKLSRMSKNPILAKIMEVKKLTKLGQFVDIELSPEGRVHTCYNVTGATMQREKKGFIVDDEDDYKSFGRWSSSKSIILPYGSGNLQNIPYKARKMYKPGDPDSINVSADYMQAEAVVVAYLINDIKLIKMFQAAFGLSRSQRAEHNYDVHKFTASQMFQIPIASVTPEQRQIGKTIRHANNYSAGPAVLAAKLNISMKEAKYLMTVYHQTCPQLRLWHQSIQGELSKTRTLYNLLGRKHRFTDRWGDDLFRSAYSYIPQSTVGDLLNLSLVKLYENHGDTIHIHLQLHDAIYVICHKDDISTTMKTMRETMLHPLRANHQEFTIDVDFSVGKSWGEMEEVEYSDYVKE